MELALNVIGQVASATGSGNLSIFRLVLRGGGGTPRTGLFSQSILTSRRAGGCPNLPSP